MIGYMTTLGKVEFAIGVKQLRDFKTMRIKSMLKYKSTETGLTGWQEMGLIAFFSFWIGIILLIITG